MIEYLPGGPITTGEMIAAFTLAVLCVTFRPGWGKMLGAAILVSWVAARWGTETRDPLILVAGFSFAGLLAAIPTDRAAQAVTWLYGLRVAFCAVLMVEWISWFWFWEINRVFLWAQYLVITGTIIDGFASGKISKKISDFSLFNFKSSRHTNG